MTTDELLSTLDVAPSAPLTAAERGHSERLLLSVLADREPAVAPRVRRARSSRGWVVAFAGALTLAVVGTAVVASHYGYFAPAQPAAAGPLSTVALASWTSTPTPATSASPAVQAAEKWCVDRMTGGPGASSPATFTNIDQRGDVTSMFVNRAGYAMLCIASADSTGFWEVDGDPSAAQSALAPTGVTIESGGGHGGGVTGLGYVEGRTGANVASISLTAAGRTFTATVANGRWAAWWPDASGTGNLDGALTVTATDGSTSTVSLASLQR